MKVQGKIVDLFNDTIFNGEIELINGKISSIKKKEENFSKYIIPGLVDSHVHIESSMLTPCQFSKLVVPRGTVAVVTDPHEIANVLGVDGVNYMINNSSFTPLKCFFGAPSCVPATNFETSGSVIDSLQVKRLLERDDIWFLSEMMNFPGVIYEDKEVMAKIAYAKRKKKQIDGHAPGLIGENLKKYAYAGISTDHECTTIDEAIDKINQGMLIQIREGSAAKNFNQLKGLYQKYANHIMLCTDDSHPDELINNGHIDKIIKLGIEDGINIFDLLRSATHKPVLHYNLPVGLLRVGDDADFCVVDNLSDFNILETYIKGEKVYGDGKINFSIQKSTPVNNFNIDPVSKDDIKVEYHENCSVKVIEAIDGDLITNQFDWYPEEINGCIQSDITEDILKVVVVNRYKVAKPSVGFIKNIGLKNGAFGCSVAHDSHNLIAVGVDDADILNALNILIKNKGGMVYYGNDKFDFLQLEIAGLMTDMDGIKVAHKYEELNRKVKDNGSYLHAPFMTLSFMSLLVIPSLKIGDRGLFDVNSFSFVNIFNP